MGESMLNSMLVGGAIGLGVVVILMLIGMMKKPVFDAPPRRHNIIASSLPPAEVAARLRALDGKDYKLAADKPEQNLVVLADTMTLLSFGNFYPCFYRAAGSGSEINVGIAPKVPQYGPVVTSKLKKVTEAVTAAVAG